MSFSSPSSSSAISASILLHTGTTTAPSSSAMAFTTSRCGLFSKPSSATLAMYITGLLVSRWKLRTRRFSSSPRFFSSERAGLPSVKWGMSFSSRAFWARASLSPPLALRATFCSCFSQLSRSAKISSRSMISMSRLGSTLLDTWITLSSSKQRTTWAMASVSRMLARNLLPRPSPLEAPATRPAMSTNSMVVGSTRSGLTISARAFRRASGIGTMPLFGSMVQNGKFSAAIPDLVRALNRVDLPTLGRPTMPQLNPMLCPSRSDRR